MKKTTETHKFKRGQKLMLDEIYTISGLGGGQWWTADDPSDAEGDGGDNVTILEDITITVSVARPSNPGHQGTTHFVRRTLDGVVGG